MPTILCPNKILCPGADTQNLEFDFPLANFSSQQPDPLLFFGFNFGGNVIPNLGDNFGDQLPGFCTSPVSQTQANLCAAQNQVINTVGGGGQSNNPAPWTNPDGTQVKTFTNDTQQCAYTCPDGLPFIWTILGGQVTALSKAKANLQAQALACQFAFKFHICLPSFTGGCLNQFFTQGIQPQGGLAPYAISVQGNLPPGVTFQQTSPNSANISGTPTQVGLFNFTILAVDANGNFMQKPYQFGVLSIPNASTIPGPSQGTFYNQQLIGAGGKPPYTFTLSPTSTLPPFLSLSPSGLISGNPTTTQKLNVQVAITDSLGTSCLVTVAPNDCLSDWNCLSPWVDNSVVLPVGGATGAASTSFANLVAHIIGTANAPNPGDSVTVSPEIDGNFNDSPPATPVAVTCTVTLRVLQGVAGVQNDIQWQINDFTNAVILGGDTVPATAGIVKTYSIKIPQGSIIDAFLGGNLSFGGGFPLGSGSIEATLTLNT